MKLSDRLEAVIVMAGASVACDASESTADAATERFFLAADIGCDHGYVSIELVRREIARRAVASDIGEGPIKSARENIARAGLGSKIETQVADGLEGFKKDTHHDAGKAAGSKTDKKFQAPDLVIISGMGGMLMKKILEEGEAVAKCAKRLVLSPQSDLEVFRKFLYESGYSISAESCVKDDGKYYFIICAKPDAAQTTGAKPDAPANPTAGDCKYGARKHFSKESLAIREELIRRDLANYKKIAASLEESSHPRLNEIKKEIILIEGILDEG